MKLQIKISGALNNFFTIFSLIVAVFFPLYSADEGSSQNMQNLASSSAISEENAMNQSSISEYNAYNIDSTLLMDIKKKNPLDESFLAKIPFLWSEKDPIGNIYPGKGVINKPNSASYQLFDKIKISPQTQSYFKVGDTLDIFVSMQFIEYEFKIANVIKRTGRCRVLESAPEKVTAELFEQWDVIRGLERVDKKTSFGTLNVDNVYAPEISVTASVFMRVEQTPGPYPYQTLIIDKGSKDRVDVGDIFGIYHITGNVSSGKLVSVGMIAHVNPSSSSLLLISLFNNSIEPGDKAVLVRKVRFSDKES